MLDSVHLILRHELPYSILPSNMSLAWSSLECSAASSFDGGLLLPQSFIIFFLPGLMLVNAAIVKSQATGLATSNSELSLQGCADRLLVWAFAARHISRPPRTC